jgi:hypothetical protein
MAAAKAAGLSSVTNFTPMPNFLKVTDRKVDMNYRKRNRREGGANTPLN